MVVDADGRLLVFAAMADRVQSTGSARKALDSVATALAACGCR
jgi:D-alanyl-D-alanine carboxypeptidase/D-alanyl-D-alanine-endopeptidase (penicillin-binding protein 4)